MTNEPTGVNEDRHGSTVDPAVLARSEGVEPRTLTLAMLAAERPARPNVLQCAFRPAVLS